jgi:predicted PurR-regulated permease PerM
VKPWVTFAGGVLVVAVLYWAQAVLVPFALAILLTFVLTPPVTWLQRWVGRVPAVLFAATLVFAALGLAGWGLTRQIDHLAEDLPGYRANIRTKIADVRLAGRGGAVEKLQETLERIKTDLGTEAPKGTVLRPVVVTSNPATGFSAFAWLGPVVGPLSTAGLVAAMVIFMLLERRDLRDRLIGLIGHGQLVTTTKALRRGRRSRQPPAVDAVPGERAVRHRGLRRTVLPPRPLPIGLGDTGRRASVRPVCRSRARGRRADARQPRGPGGVDGSVDGPRIVRGPRAVHESRARIGAVRRAVGVSQVVLVVSVTFWTWLWGPLGLLMASPLTVCLVVLGKHVPGLAFVGLLMDDTPSLAPEYGFYQRLVARDQSEAAELIDRHQDRVARIGVRRATAAGTQLCRARPIGAPALLGGRSGGDRCGPGVDR